MNPHHLFTTALLVGLISTGASAQTQPVNGAGRSDSAETRLQLRELWGQHAAWSRDYIVAVLSNTADADVAGQRLRKNDQDLGTAIGRFYGEAAGRQFSDLLDKQVALTATTAQAAVLDAGAVGTSAGQPLRLDRLAAEWRANAEGLASTVGWRTSGTATDTGATALVAYVLATQRQIAARAGKNWSDDVRGFDEAYANAMRVADAVCDAAIEHSSRGVGTSGIR